MFIKRAGECTKYTDLPPPPTSPHGTRPDPIAGEDDLSRNGVWETSVLSPRPKDVLIRPWSILLH